MAPKTLRSFCTSTSYAMRNAGAKLYQHTTHMHVKVLIPASMMKRGRSIEFLGRKFEANHTKRTFSGEIPAAWLVDLNGPLPGDAS